MDNLSGNDTGLPVVSISCLTYNHASFLRQCLDSFLMQRTNFAFEVIIHDDASTDGTKEIIEEYAARYPDLFLPIFQKENKYLKGTRGMAFRYNLPRCRGKYVALCEGDDYWTDPLKLQKQVDFLENNEDFAICFHRAIQKNEFDETKNLIFPPIEKDTVFYIEDYILDNITATCSIMFKRDCFPYLPDYFTKITFGDIGTVLAVMDNSNPKGMVLKDIMGVYRVHEGGTFGRFLKSSKSFIDGYKRDIDEINITAKELFKNRKYEKWIVKKKRNVYRIISILCLKNFMLKGFFISLIKSLYYAIIYTTGYHKK